MRKSLELTSVDSCLNRALPEEYIFVMLARDIAAPAAIRAWCEARIVAGKNHRGDAQISEALRLAEKMEAQNIALRRDHVLEIAARRR